MERTCVKLQEYKVDDEGRKLYRILEDKILIGDLYSNLYHELYSEIRKQYNSAKNHFYYLSDKAYKQYMEYKYGLVDMI